ncbi:hypothetical protein MTO96_016718 [Rhipicephalus appendiculatus]
MDADHISASTEKSDAAASSAKWCCCSFELAPAVVPATTPREGCSTSAPCARSDQPHMVEYARRWTFERVSASAVPFILTKLAVHRIQTRFGVPGAMWRKAL